MQQLAYFKTGVNPKNRIVCIQKDYLIPIVRGKEVKPVEFGAKVNKLQIDGINFIEHLSFNAFNEGTRLRSTTIAYQKKLTEKFWIFLGIHTTNALEIGRRMQDSKTKRGTTTPCLNLN